MKLWTRSAVGLRVLALVVLSAACDGIDNIDVDVAGRAAVPARTVLDDLLGLVPFEGFDSVDFEQEFRNQGVNEEDVDSVRVKAFTLTIESPPDQSFEFLDGIAFFASAGGLDEVRIASATSIPAGARSIELTLDDVELEPYATAAKMTIRGEVQGERPASATTLRADVTFDVDITIPGCN